jgi:hypothetical protein
MNHGEAQLRGCEAEDDEAQPAAAAGPRDPEMFVVVVVVDARDAHIRARAWVRDRDASV